MKLEEMTYFDVDQWASWTHYESGVFADMDGSTTGASTGRGDQPAWFAPPSGQLWINPHCQYVPPLGIAAARIPGRTPCGWQMYNPDYYDHDTGARLLGSSRHSRLPIQWKWRACWQSKGPFVAREVSQITLHM